MNQQPIIQLTKDGVFVARHESITAAAKSVRGGKGNIGMACQGYRSTAKGYKWKYEVDYLALCSETA